MAVLPPGVNRRSVETIDSGKRKSERTMAASTVIDNLDRLFAAPAIAGGGPPTAAVSKAAFGGKTDPDAPPRRPPGCFAPQQQQQTQTHAQEMVALDRFIEGEIRDRVRAPNMTWRKLEACFKWRALQDYMAARGIASGSSDFQQVTFSPGAYVGGEEGRRPGGPPSLLVPPHMPLAKA
jgi:hypothetical protein